MTLQLDPTMPNAPHRDGAEALVNGRTSGVWYRWVDADYAEVAVREGLRPFRRGYATDAQRARWEPTLWDRVYGDGSHVHPHFVSRNPLGWDGWSDGGPATLLRIDADGLLLAPDYNMVNEDWHMDIARDGHVVLHDYSTADENPIAAYTVADLRTDRVASYLLFDGHAACIIEDVEAGRVSIVADPARLAAAG